MKIQSVALVMAVALAGAAQGAEDTKGIDKQAQDIIANKCIKCHGADRIKAAFSAGKDMRIIQKEMQRRGANLSGSEQEVMGIYWKQKLPLK